MKIQTGKRRGGPWVFVLGWFVLFTSGCALFNSPRKDDVSYENAQREINGPSQNWQNGVRQASYEAEQQQQAKQAEEDKGFSWDDLKPSALGENLKSIQGKGKNPEVARQLYDEADGVYKQALEAQGDERKRLFLQAAQGFARAAERWPGSTLEHDALYHQGESLFFADHYVEANECFELVIAKYKNSRYMDEIDVRRFKLAEYWLDWEEENGESIVSMNLMDNERPWRDTKGHALRLYDKIRLDDPTGKLADDATMAAANAYFLAGDYLKADMFYTDLRRTYPSSEFQFKAHYLGMQAKLQCYEGENYSVTPLEEAGKLVDQMRKQFPEEYSKEEYRAEIDTAHAQVRKMMAERHWRMATYYENRWDNKGARYYYNIIVRDFPGTPIAEEARARLAALADEPADPPEPLRPLANLFQAGKDKLDIPTKEEKTAAAQAAQQEAIR